MSEQIAITEATYKDSDLIAQLVYDLLIELFEDQAHSFELEKLQKAAVQLINEASSVWSFIAKYNDEIAGYININQCSAIYAGGHFGEITELYVVPKYRSKDIGAHLIQHAKDFSQEKGWKVIEVGAPDVPRCQRTVNFYLRNGFREVGPRLETIIKP